ncbi:MAG: hypothetical protein L6Q47_10815 [Ignavibacteriaceae bacterium]|nr:hypothetical protein [Ignavibacteriaceae bacterium]
MKRLSLFPLFLLLGLLTTGCGIIWTSPAYYTPSAEVELLAPIMSREGYDSVHAHFTRPYIVYIEGERSALVFGASHTKDPDDPQLAKIDSLWHAFNPDAALVEGRLGFLLKGLMDPVVNHGEGGYVYNLARQKGIEVYSWDPAIDQDVKNTLRYYTPRQTALFYVLRPYFSNFRFGKPDDPDAFVEEFRAKRTKIPGLEGSLNSIAEIDSIWAADFKGLPDWRETSDAYGLPLYLGSIAALSNNYRDEHFVKTIADLTKKGKRVFAVAGSSHAVKIERSLKETLSSKQP